MTKPNDPNFVLTAAFYQFTAYYEGPMRVYMIPLGGEPFIHEEPAPESVPYETIRRLADTAGIGYLEAVRIRLYPFTRIMYIDEDGKAKGMQRNEFATILHRMDTIRRHPHTNPETLDYIVGPAMIFLNRTDL